MHVGFIVGLGLLHNTHVGFIVGLGLLHNTHVGFIIGWCSVVSVTVYMKWDS